MIFLAVRRDTWQEKHGSVTYVKSSRMLEYKVKLYGCDLVKVDEYPAFRHGECQTRGKYILPGQW